MKALVLLLLLPVMSFADTASDYQAAQNYIHSQHLSTQLVVSQKHLPIEPKKPTQQNYYQHPEKLKEEASIQASNSVAEDAAFDRSSILINKDSPDIKAAQKIQANAGSIVDGTYQDCQKKTIDRVTTVEKKCETGHSFQFSCVKTLNVTIQKTQVNTQKTLSLSSSMNYNGSSVARIYPADKTGIVNALSLYIHNGSNPWSCFQLYQLFVNGVYVASYHGQCGRLLGELAFNFGGRRIPFSNGVISLSLNSGGWSGQVSGSLVVTVKQPKTVIQKNWDSSCAAVPDSCVAKNETCLTSSMTKVIDGVSVTENCWKKVTNYQCGRPLSTACLVLKNQGCTQIDKETWSCPDKKVVGEGLLCGEHFYCLQGHCQAIDHKSNPDFGKSVTALSSVAQSADEIKKQGLPSTVDPNQIRVFTGSSASCSMDATHIVDCCSDTGWGKGLLAHCTDKEKALGRAKQAGRVAFVEDYCHLKVAGICLEHNKRYCVFQSKLALDLQVQGRQSQLGRSFGTGKKPDCSGLTAAELSHLNYGAMDFSNIVDSVTHQKKLPDDEVIKKMIQERITARADQPNSPYFKEGL